MQTLKKQYPRKLAIQFLLPAALVITIVSCRSNSLSPTPSEIEPTFTNVQQILKSSCGGGNCHIGQTTSGVRLDNYQNVITSRGQQYGEAVIQPDKADNSPIINKISNSAPKFGTRMPFGRSPLSETQISIIKQWIDNGAAND